MIWTNQCFCGATNTTNRLKVGMRCETCNGILAFNEWQTDDGRPAQLFFEQLRRRKAKK